MADIVSYSAGDLVRQAKNQTTFRELLAKAAQSAHLHPDTWEIQPSGDGVLAALPSDEEEPLIVDGFIRHLNKLLRRHNADQAPADWLRLRVAIHFGVYLPAANGYAGQTPIRAGRLVDAEPIRRAIEQAGKAHLAVILSDEIYQASVATSLTTWDPEEFREVQVVVKTYKGTGWLHVPGTDVHTLDLEPLRARNERDRTADQSVSTVFNGPVHMGDHGVIGISNR